MSTDSSTSTPASDSAVNLPTVSFQKSVIASNLNSSLIFTFLMGIYTMVYARTVYMYYMRNLSRGSSDTVHNVQKHGSGRNVSKVPIIAITALYVICFAMFCLEWYFLEWVVVEQGDTRESVFAGSIGEAPNWFIVIMSVLQYSLFAIADGLLIWRCFKVWNRSIYVVAVLLPLLLAEIGLGITVTIYSVMIPVLTTPKQAALANDVQAAAPFVSFGTTVLTTFLIAYRIHSTTRLGGVLISLQRFRHIMTILLESAGAYSIMLLFWAILSTIPAAFNIDMESPVYYSTFYVYLIFLITAGLAPTVVVARIVMSDSDDETRRSIGGQISNLDFRNDEGVESQEEKLKA